MMRQMSGLGGAGGSPFNELDDLNVDVSFILMK